MILNQNESMCQNMIFLQTFNKYEFHHFQLTSQISTHGIL
jgi:hypothetical protein